MRFDGNKVLGLTITAGFLIGIALVVVGVAFSGCGKAEQSTQAPSRPPYIAKTHLSGTSMLPAFTDGEAVGLELCRYDDLASGQPVIRWDSVAKLYVAHRVVFRNETGRWVTRGDNNASIDRGVMTPEEFVGRVLKLSP